MSKHQKVVLGPGAKGDLEHPELTQAQLDARDAVKPAAAEAAEAAKADGE